MKSLFKYASLLFAAAMLCGFSCEGSIDTGDEENENNGGNNGSTVTGIYLVSDKDVIQADGEDVATLRAMVGDTDVTAETTFYDESNNELTLKGGKFTTTAVGEYKFWASYGTYSTYDKDREDKGLLTVKSINVPVPSVAKDTKPSATNFVHRAFLTQYTGTGCGYCPYMIKILKKLMADNTIPDKAVLAAVHSFGPGDPAYISAPKVSNYPYLHVDLVNGFNHAAGDGPLYTLIDESIASDAQAGISANSKLYDDGTLVIRVSVKAAVDGEYRVGAWLLEDGIYGAQADKDNVGKGDSSYNTHENCVRLIDSRYDGAWCGQPLGTIKAGNTAEKTFVMNVKNSWKKENLHMALIVSSLDGKKYKVCNAIDCPINGETPFEYE